MEKVILTIDSYHVKFVGAGVETLNKELRERLLTSVVHFSFKKKDGSIREAFGTLHPEKIIIPESGQKINENPTIGTYFDLEANAWRSYTIANLIAVY